MVTVVVPWESKQTEVWWNETCAMILEHFGLPGDKYTSHPTENAMSFIFHDAKDALLCKILLSDRI